MQETYAIYEQMESTEHIIYTECDLQSKHSDDELNSDKRKITPEEADAIKANHHFKKKIILAFVYSIFIMSWFGMFISIMEINDPQNFTIHGMTLYVRGAISFGFFAITPALFWMYETIFLHNAEHYSIEKSVLIFDALISVILYGQYYRYG